MTYCTYESTCSRPRKKSRSAARAVPSLLSRLTVRRISPAVHIFCDTLHVGWRHTASSKFTAFVHRLHGNVPVCATPIDAPAISDHVGPEALVPSRVGNGRLLHCGGATRVHQPSREAWCRDAFDSRWTVQTRTNFASAG